MADITIEAFYGLRRIDYIEKKPATRELINWIRALHADPDFNPKQLKKGDIPYLGILYKKSQDFDMAQNAISRKRLF